MIYGLFPRPVLRYLLRLDIGTERYLQGERRCMAFLNQVEQAFAKETLKF